MSTALTAARTDTDNRVGWTPTQHLALDGLGIPPDRTTRAMLFEICLRSGLDPFKRHIWLVQRDDRWQPLATIDGFRSVAESSGVYRGQLGPEWCDEDGEWATKWTKKHPPFAARVGVLRADFDEPLWGTAHFPEYAATRPVFEGSGEHRRVVREEPTGFWERMPRGQLAKCAEALALRRAFPQRLGGLYTVDEMQQATNGRRDRNYEEIERQRNAGEPSQPRRLDPQKGAEMARAAETPDQVHALYAYAKDNRALSQLIHDPTTGETWMFGVYLLFTAASKARDADTVRRIRSEAEPVLNQPIPGCDGSYTLGDYLNECITTLDRQDSPGDQVEETSTTATDGRTYTEDQLHAALGSGHPDVETHARYLLEQGPNADGLYQDDGSGPGFPAADYPGELGDDGEGAEDSHSGDTDAATGSAGTEEFDGEDASWETPPGDGALTDD